MIACTCGHPKTTHLGGAGVCTVLGCKCDEYAEAARTVSAEAQQLAADICRTGTSASAIAAAVQNLIDQRVSWEREAAKLLAQRDYSEGRTNELEQRLVALVEQLRAVLAKFDNGAVR